MAQTKTADAPAGAATEEQSVLDRIIQEGRGKMVQVFATQVLAEKIQRKDSAAASIQERIADIDEQIGAQLNAILHDRGFQRLEATWRGLFQLVMGSETGTQLKLRVLNATRGELQKDLDKAVEFDQSNLFKKIYEEEYGTFGGAPFSVLIGDYEFGRHPDDTGFLEKMSGVAAAAHAPFIAAADPKLFDMESFAELGIPRDLAKTFESTEMIAWNAFRDSDDARYVALVLPHYLLRLPYGPDTSPVEGLNGFVENVAPGPDVPALVAERNGNGKKAEKKRRPGSEREKFLWGNAAWQLGLRITDAFAQHGWTAAIRGVEGGGLVEGLPVYPFKALEGDKTMQCPTEVAITDRREKELSDQGFIALCHRKGDNRAAFFGGATTQKPKKYNTNQANANARLSATLPYLLAASRFAHYLKVMMRDKIGSFASKSSIEKYLNDWISEYVLLNDDAPQSAKARFPLREARVDVTEIPGKPGAYNATVFLRPHFQLEELTASIRLVAELPPPAA